jgi:hypothetical protein
MEQRVKKSSAGQSDVKLFHVFVLFRNDVIVNIKKTCNNSEKKKPESRTSDFWPLTPVGGQVKIMVRA